MNDQPDEKPAQSLKGRLVAGFTLALSIALTAFFLINESASYNVAFGSLWFLAILPAYLCALICYIGDPKGEKPRSFYTTAPLVFAAVVIVGAIFILHEGVICLLMLAPIWLAFGWIGAAQMRRFRNRSSDSFKVHSSLLLLPLFSGAIETQIAVPHDQITLTRDIVINAAPEEIWPFAVANPHIGETEGRWTFTQNIVGLPRPRATTLKGTGVGAVRTAYWGDHVNFEERITTWQPGRKLGWTFAFTNTSMRDYTDKHIAPDGEFLKIDTGDYTFTPIGAGKTLVTLRTVYIAKTHVNFYASLWGEILLGDVENNILAIIKDRAEAKHGQAIAAR